MGPQQLDLIKGRVWMSLYLYICIILNNIKRLELELHVFKTCCVLYSGRFSHTLLRLFKGIVRTTFWNRFLLCSSPQKIINYTFLVKTHIGADDNDSGGGTHHHQHAAEAAAALAAVLPSFVPLFQDYCIWTACLFNTETLPLSMLHPACFFKGPICSILKVSVGIKLWLWTIFWLKQYFTIRCSSWNIPVTC